MIIVGLNGVSGIFHDASATLIVDGEIVTSVEEERFNRIKHTNGIPYLSIDYCLTKAGIKFQDIDHIGYYLDPDVLEKTFYTDIIDRFQLKSSIAYIADAARNIRSVPKNLQERFGAWDKTQFHFMNHHVAHAASAFYISGFEQAAVLTVDGSGDRESSTLYLGTPEGLRKINEYLVYPESLGFIYTVFAAHLGLGWIAGPGKMMGLSAYGTSDLDLFNDIIIHKDDPRKPIEIDLSFFDYYSGGTGLSAKGRERFGTAIPEGEAPTQAASNLAASAQAAVQNAVIHLARTIPQILPEKNLCFAGGVALNVLINRRLRDLGVFEHLFVTPAAYDGGTSLGCALHLSHKYHRKTQHAFNVYTGPDIEVDFNIRAACRKFEDRIQWKKLDERELLERATDALVRNKIIGWVQGRMECGPRALGNRSLLANASDPKAKDELNRRVKKREPFRPYAPSVLKQEALNWFDIDDSPYMLLEAQVQPNKRDKVPSITHVDNTARPQTVTEADNPRYYRLLKLFFEKSGVPMVLNTSFNRHGEPAVNSPEDAIAVLLETDLDELFVGDYQIRRR